jgi:hypothetical protein
MNASLSRCLWIARITFLEAIRQRFFAFLFARQLPPIVTNIGFGAFSSCENLTNIVIGDSVTNIEASAFFGCLNLTNITLGAGLRTLGNDPFDECYALTTFTISPSNSVFASQDGLLYNKDKTVLIRCSEGVRGNCIIPASVTEIKALAFLNVLNIKKLYFLGDAPTLNGYTFSGTSPICYLPGTTGWGATYSGIDTLLWNPQAQSLGVNSNQFSFTITGTSNIEYVIETSTNLNSLSWQMIATNTLTNGTAYFSYPRGTNGPVHYYRFRSP